MTDSSIYRPFTKLVRVRVLDCWFEVPENNILLVGATPGQQFEALSFAAFMHLLERHTEHINAACHPMMGAVSNYLASLTLRSDDPEFTTAQQGARASINSWLDGIQWSAALKRFQFLAVAANTPPEPSEPI